MTEAILNSVYFEKQKKFVALIKEIQTSLNSKEYKNQGYTFNEYIKIKWNISQAQAYRYLLCGKVLDQLEEFEIKPSYERLCKALANVAKTPIQMKILWDAILKKTGGRPDCVNSTHVNNIWKEICSNKKYSDICKYEDDIMNKIEKSLSNYENEKKHKRLNSNKKIDKINNNDISASNDNNNNNSGQKKKKINNKVINGISKDNKENNSMNNKFPTNINTPQYLKYYNNTSNTLSVSNHPFHNTSVVPKTVLQTPPLSFNSINTSSTVSNISFQNTSSSLSNNSVQNILSMSNNNSIYNSNSSVSNNSNVAISSMPSIITNNNLSNTSVVFNSFSNISLPISEGSSFNSYSVSNNSVSTIPVAPNTLSNTTFISCPIYNTQVIPQILSNSYIPQNNSISNVSNNSISNIPVISNTASDVSVVSNSTNIPEIKNSIINVPEMNNYVTNGLILPTTVTSTLNIVVDTSNRQLTMGNTNVNENIHTHSLSPSYVGNNYNHPNNLHK